jgi:hypothetical protein
MRELEDLPAVETIATAGPELEDLVLGNEHGSAWPTSPRDTAELAAWRGRSLSRARGAAVDSLDAELERIAGRA